MNANIEIELIIENDISRELLVEFRNCLSEEIPGFEFKFREMPPLPGQMSGDSINWVYLVIEALSVASIEVLVGETLDSLKERIVEKVKKGRDRYSKEKNISPIKLGGTIRVNSEKTNFKIEKSIKYYDGSIYSIDPEHTHVVIAGCGKFKQEGINPIPAVELNIKEIYNLFVDKEYFAIPPGNIETSYSEDSETLNTLLLDVSHRKGIETFIFYYAGHGFCVDTDSYYLAAFNTVKRNNVVIGGIEKEFLKNNILKRSPAKQKIAIIDACYSGVLAQRDNIEPFTNEVSGSYILTSSSAVGASFFSTDEKYTFFTGALIQTIKSNGNISNDVITLDDLYEGTKEILQENNRQLPVFKNGLSIPPSNYIISNNPSFSFEGGIKRVHQYLKEDKVSDLLKTLERLKKYLTIRKTDGSHDNAKKSEKSNLNENRFTQLVEECTLFYENKGDELFKLKNYKTAIKYYETALLIKAENRIDEKIENCSKIISKRWKKRWKMAITFIAISLALILSKAMLEKLFPPHEDARKETNVVTLKQEKPPIPNSLDTSWKITLSFANAKMIDAEKRKDWFAALSKANEIKGMLQTNSPSASLQDLNARILRYQVQITDPNKKDNIAISPKIPTQPKDTASQQTISTKTPVICKDCDNSYPGLRFGDGLIVLQRPINNRRNWCIFEISTQREIQCFECETCSLSPNGNELIAIRSGKPPLYFDSKGHQIPNR